MKYRALGNSDLNISEISFGCMSLKPGAAENEQVLRAAVENGINFFDTADLYDRGENERILGRALHSVRDQIVIATKVGNRWKSDGSEWEWAASKEYIKTTIEDSLRRLKTDYIDLYQLHGGTIDDPIDELVEAFELLKKEGKIRAYGISSIRPNVIREYASRSNIDSVMMQYSLLDRRPEEECLNLLRSKGIGVLARGSLAKGLLIDKAPRPYLDYSEKEVEMIQSAVRKTNNPISSALHFVLKSPAIASAVSGMRTQDHLSSTLDGYHHSLSHEEITQLEQVLPISTYSQHR